MFTTKRYTLVSLINEVSSLKPSQVTSLYTLKNAVSPRVAEGQVSAKLYAIDNFLNGNLTSVINGRGKFASLGKTGRTRLLRALKNRKANSY